MSDIPDQPVCRRIEDVMQRDAEFDDTKTGRKMTAGLRNRVYKELPNLSSQLREFPWGEFSNIRWRRNVIEQFMGRIWCGVWHTVYLGIIGCSLTHL